jgi:Flp pilus assembly pilin Flp
MDQITKLFVKVREFQRGQTMTEYALILSAVAVVVFVGYNGALLIASAMCSTVTRFTRIPMEIKLSHLPMQILAADVLRSARIPSEPVTAALQDVGSAVDTQHGSPRRQ